MRSLPILELPPPKPNFSNQVAHGLSTPRVKRSQKPIVEANETVVGNVKEQHMRPISAMKISEAGESPLLFTAGMDGLVCQWDIGSQDLNSIPALLHSARPHRNWIWDMAMCRGQETVVTCSSDCTVKAWNAGTDGSCYELGAHGDFVKSLASAPAAEWVASGSLDHTVCLWDLKEGRPEPMWRATAPASIYSTACNYTGSVTVTGGVDRTIHGWDPRVRDPTFELFGHTDNVRTMCMSPDGRYLLSGSSDATVRLWSVGEQRCLHTFMHHTSSVWSLHSRDPQLTTFYSGDRDGFLCKMNWDHTTDLSQGQCVVLAQEGHNETGPLPSVLSIAVDQQHQTVWTSNLATSAFHCWKDVPLGFSQETGLPNTSDVPLQSRVNLEPLRLPDLFASTGSPSAHPLASPIIATDDAPQQEQCNTVEEATPLSTTPLLEVPGSCGIVRACMLNDRMHALTIDSSGMVALWHIPKARCLGTFDPDSLQAMARAQNQGDDWLPQSKPSDTLEMVQAVIEGDGITQSWCSLDTSTGQLIVCIDENRAWAAEVYADEFNMDVVSGEEQPWTEDRVVLGICVLRNLFRGLLLAEATLHPPENNDGVPQLVRWLTMLQVAPEDLLHVPLSQLPNAPPCDSMEQSIHSILAYMTGTSHAKTKANVSVPSHVTDSPLETALLHLLYKVQAYFSAPAGTTSVSPSETGGSFLSGLRRSNQKQMSRSDMLCKLNEANLEQEMKVLQSILQGPRRSAPPSPGTPGIFFTDDIVIELLQDISHSGESKVAYRGCVESISRDTPLLELLAPSWLLKVLFIRQNPNKELPRIRVHLEKWAPAQVNGMASMKHALEAPPLSTKYSSVTTPRLLRVARIAEYVYQSLLASGEQPPAHQSSSSVDAPIDIMFRNITLPPRMF
ncbi:hypothetical protein MNAN1_000107 [Malassezia nana]|uniref:Uncharacterized protein n=1 Tax=Malassezia nana TaxID=180528 RepID=A0AAF0EGN1_9BASI|nr:hypothetical protein MNAN1_000107 [Malassezia nana]